MFARTTLVLFPALVAAAFAAEPNRLTAEEKAAGWQLLFDGSTTDGWLEISGKPFPRECWSIDGGCLHARARDSKQDIRTAGAWRSFDLQFDWKLSANGNSGVKYLVQRPDEWVNKLGRQARARGLEYQLADPRNEEATGPERTTGALYSLIAPQPASKAAVGEFHHSRIVVRGRRVEHWLDGVKIVEFSTTDAPVEKLLRANLPKGSPPDAPLAAESPISLQNHTADAWFRNLKIRRIE